MNHLERDPPKGTTVFITSGTLVAAVAAWGLLASDSLQRVAELGLGFSTRNFGWFLLLTVSVCLVFCLWLIISPWGRVRLGSDDQRPEYSNIAWWGMIFTAGMGVGLVFWGVAEPLTHFAEPPMGSPEARTPEAARKAVVFSFFHWGLHPWAVYAVTGLAMALAQFRCGRRALISAACAAALGSKGSRPAIAALDILATLATVFGVATTFGLATLQIGRGLHLLFGWSNGAELWLGIIATATVFYVGAAVLGIDRGMRRMSNLNMVLAYGLLLFVFTFGPTRFIVAALTTGLGDYLSQLVPLSLRLEPFAPADSPAATWSANWTLFYWAWWIAWAPAVGGFIARISRGRTIREFLTGVLLLPTLLSLVWFAVFGGAGLHFDLHVIAQLAAGAPSGTVSEAALRLAGDGGLATAVQRDVTSAFFQSLSLFPGGAWLNVLAVVVIAIFFVTSAEATTLALAMYTSGGSPNPSRFLKIFWGIAQALVAVALLLTGGKTMLNTFQTAAIVAALPFAAVLVLLMWAITKMICEHAPLLPFAMHRPYRDVR